MKPIALYSTLLPLALTAGLLFVAPSIVTPDSRQTAAVGEPQDAGNIRAADDSTRLYLPDDLEATLWAETPMFYNPTSMDIDARGRVWITEAVNYRKFNTKAGDRLDHPDGERIMILQDTDGDGKADKSKMFVQDPDIVSPLGIAVVGNKIIVSCSPNLIIYTDENGDDRPDRKEILLTGFGGLDHDHGLHSLVAGPDGRYYVNTGNAGPHVVTDKAGWTLRSGSVYVGGTPYNTENRGNQVSDDGRVWTGGLSLRINPDGTDLKVMGHNARNSSETAIDSYGNLWQSDGDDGVMACRTNWLMEGGNAGYFSADGTRNWQGDQRPGQSSQTAHWHQEDPGVLPVGDVTGAGSPKGMTVYESDALGPNYQGMLLSADAGRNVVFGYRTEPMGAGYRMLRTNFVSTFPEADEGSKLSDKATDTRKWFRPSDVAVGTDGAVYVADWYDPVAGENRMDDRKGYGRIYRITPKGQNLRAPKIDLSSTKGQIDALLSPAINVRMAGFTALKAQGAGVLEPVMNLLSSSNQYHRARAVFLMVHLGPEGQFEVERLLKAADASVRIAALRALRSITPENSKASSDLTASQRALLPLLGNLSLDQNAAVRREVAVAVRDMPYQDCRYIIQNLVKAYDGQDRYYLNALGIAADGKQDYVFADLRPTLPENPVSWDARTANLVWELHPTAAVPMLAKRADASALSADARKQAITTLGFINDTSAVRVMMDLTKSTDKDVAAQAQYWTNFRRGNDWVKLADWKGPIFQKTPTAEQKMLTKRQELLSDSKSDAEKRKIALEMARTPDGGQILIDLAAEKKLSDNLIRAVGPVILRNPDPTIRTMAKEYFTAKSTKPADEPAQWESKAATSVDTKTRAVVTPVSEKVAVLTGNPKETTLTGNQKAGSVVFNANCANCHRYGKLGNNVGPDLTHIHQRLSKDALLESIVNPSAVIATGYEPWLITTKKGQTFYGFLVGDNEQSVVIKSATGQQHTISADQVLSRRQYKTSLMPTAETMKLNQQQLADLMAFLLKQ